MEVNRGGRGHVKSMLAAVEQIASENAAVAERLFSHARAYLALLREHIRKEDDILFRMADEVLPRDEQLQILEQFEAHVAVEIRP